MHRVGTRAEGASASVRSGPSLPADVPNVIRTSLGRTTPASVSHGRSRSSQLIVADGPLDVTVRAQVLDLLAGLQRERGIAFLFISHDLAVVQHVSHEVAVMYLGKIVEHASVDALYAAPKHPYTQALLSAVPSLDATTRQTRIVLDGEVPSPVAPPSGCPFHPRCPQVMPVCSRLVPQELNIGTAESPHRVSCHLY